MTLTTIMMEFPILKTLMMITTESLIRYKKLNLGALQERSKNHSTMTMMVLSIGQMMTLMGMESPIL